MLGQAGDMNSGIVGATEPVGFSGYYTRDPNSMGSLPISMTGTANPTLSEKITFSMRFADPIFVPIARSVPFHDRMFYSAIQILPGGGSV